MVAVDSPGATGEILQGGRFGLLVPDAGPEALAEGMLKVMRDTARRKAYATRAPDAVQSLAPSVIADQWLEEICRCARGKAGNRQSIDQPKSRG